MDLNKFIGQGIFFFARARLRPRTENIKTTLILLSAFFGLLTNGHALDAQLTKTSRAMKDSKLEVCLPAVESLGRSINPDAITVLTQAYDNESRPLVRRYIVDALGRSPSKRSLPTLTKAINDSDEAIRQSATVALSALGPMGEQALIDHAAVEKSPAVKTYLAQALGRSRHPDAKQKLETLSSDSDPDTKRLAKDALQKLKNRKK